jgi:pimeloyl-ACP methyl ester carboxylesterase
MNIPAQSFSYLFALSLACSACASATDAPAPAPDGGSMSPVELSVACKDSVDAVYEPVTALPSYDASHRGDVVRCAANGKLSVSDVEGILKRSQFVDVDVKSAVKVYRIAYRTERLVGQATATTAYLFLPDQPVATRAPVVIAAHGAFGLAPSCRFSTAVKFSDATDERTDAFLTETGMMLMFAGAGYPVIAPDFPGWSEDAITSAYFAQDMAHALLDGTRAMHHLVDAGSLDDQVVLVGHSQGGYAVLSAQALAADYGLEGHLVAVASFAGGWVPARAFGDIISKEAAFTTADNAELIGAAMGYFYSHAEVYDGAGSGKRLFQLEKRDAVASVFGPATSCGPDVVPDAVKTLGAAPADIFDPAFASALGTCSLLNTNCDVEPAATWLKRFRADRPAMDTTGADVLFWAGAKDTTSTPPLNKCGIDKISSDLSGATAHLTACGDPVANHVRLMSNNMAWTARWIAARTLGAAEPETCAGVDALQASDGSALACPSIPGNID